MDGQRFDDLARTLAAGVSRRAVLRALAAGVVGGLFARHPAHAQACRRDGEPCSDADPCCRAGACCNGVCCDLDSTCAGGACCNDLRECNGTCCPPCHNCDRSSGTCRPCGECERCDGQTGACFPKPGKPCGQCADCDLVTGRCVDNYRCVCRQRGGSGPGAATWEVAGSAPVECGLCEECDPDLGCVPKRCGPCEVCQDGTCVACPSGACCPDGTCADAGQCCEGEVRCADGSCISTGCCPDEKVCGGGCIAGDSCCPYDERTCPDGTCVALGACCAGEEPCDVGLEPCCNTFAGEVCSFHDGCCNTLLFEVCNGHCVDTDTDPANCGGCDNTCTGGRTCVNGHCECPTGKELCGQQCVDPCPEGQTRNATCGCGCSGFQTGCAAHEVCRDGACVAVCPAPGGGGVHCGTFVACEVDGGAQCHCNSCGNVCQSGEACCATGCRYVVTTCADHDQC